MEQKRVEKDRDGQEAVRIKTLEDLITLNLKTLEQVVDGIIDNRRAQLIFTGSRTVSSTLKLGIEAMKLGLGKIAGLPVGDSDKLLEQKGE